MRTSEPEMAGFFIISQLWMLTVVFSSAAAMEFAMRPENVTGYVGDTIILTCTVDDKEEDRPVFWQRYDGFSNRLGPVSRDRDTASYMHHFPNLSPRLEVVGDESRGEYHLLISNLSIQDQGRFVCSFFNEGGYGVYAPITFVSVLPRTRVAIREGIDPVCQATVSSPLQAVTIGTTVELVCDAYGRPDITSLAWYVGTSENSALVGSCTLLKGLPQRICTFRRTLALQDVGVTFTCIATVGPSEQRHEARPGFSTEPSCNLQPLSKKTAVDIEPHAIHVTTGETATFFCSARIYPSLSPLRYTWFLNTDQQLRSATSQLMISSTSGYMQDNYVTCVVSDHFGYLGHGTAVLVVDMARDRTTHTSIDTTNDMITEHTEPISLDTSYTGSKNTSIDVLKPPSNPENRSTTVFPLVLVISLALGTILMAILLALVTACIIKQKKRDRVNLDNKDIQLDDLRPTKDLNNVYRSSKKSQQNLKGPAPRVPSAITNRPTSDPGTDESLDNNNRSLTTYAVLDPDQVDNDSLSSLDLREIIKKSESGSQEEPGDGTMYHPKGSPNATSTGRVHSKLALGRSASTPQGPVTVYAGGNKTQEGSAVAYAVTNIVGDRPEVAENTDKNPPASYDNNRISSYAVSSKVLSRKRAMSSPMTKVSSTTGDEATTTSSNSSSIGANPLDTSRARLFADDTCVYAEISEVADNTSRDVSGVCPREPGKTLQNEGAVQEPLFPRSRPLSDNAYAISAVLSPDEKE